MAGGTAAVLVVVLLLVTAMTTYTNQRAKAAARASQGLPAGYQTYSGRTGRPLAVGSPYGGRCDLVLLVLPDNVPFAFRTELTGVIAYEEGAG